MIIFAHRGFSGKYPEGTRVSFVKAIEEHSDFLEADIQLTGDGTWVIYHDRTLKRITGIEKSVSDCSLDELKQLDIGSWVSDDFSDERIITLDELIGIVLSCKGKTGLNLELKRHQHITDDSLISLLQKTKKLDVIYSSFDKDLLRRLYKLENKIRLGWIIGDVPSKRVDFSDDFPLFSIHPEKSIINDEDILKWKSKKLEIFVWTVNSENDMNTVMSWNVGGFFTDYPGRAVSFIKERDK